MDIKVIIILLSLFLPSTLHATSVLIGWTNYHTVNLSNDLHTFFNLYRSTNGQAFINIATIQDPVFTVTSYTDSSTGDFSLNFYCYQLTAGSLLYGESPPSSTTCTPGAGNFVNLAWDNYHSLYPNPSDDMHHYFNIYRSANGGVFTSIAIIQDLSQIINSYTDNTVGALSNNIYCYQITAGTDAIPVSVPKGSQTIRFVDSEKTATGDFRAVLSIDTLLSTFWHTRFSPVVDPLPHQIQIDNSIAYNITSLVYTPRTDVRINGTILGYILYISNDPSNWGTPVVTGNFSASTLPQTVPIALKSGRYFRLIATSEIN